MRLPPPGEQGAVPTKSRPPGRRGSERRKGLCFVPLRLEDSVGQQTAGPGARLAGGLQGVSSWSTMSAGQGGLSHAHGRVAERRWVPRGLRKRLVSHPRPRAEGWTLQSAVRPSPQGSDGVARPSADGLSPLPTILSTAECVRRGHRHRWCSLWAMRWSRVWEVTPGPWQADSGSERLSGPQFPLLHEEEVDPQSCHFNRRGSWSGIQCTERRASRWLARGLRGRHAPRHPRPCPFAALPSSLRPSGVCPLVPRRCRGQSGWVPVALPGPHAGPWVQGAAV